jgi:hypothetical protein
MLAEIGSPVRSEQSEHGGLERSRGAAFAVQLPEDALEMGAHRRWADAESKRRLLVAFAQAYSAQHFDLARRQHSSPILCRQGRRWETAVGFASASTTLPSNRPSATSLRRCSIAISWGSASRQGRRAVNASHAEATGNTRNSSGCG